MDPIDKQTVIFYLSALQDQQKALEILQYLTSKGINLEFRDTLDQNFIFYLSKDGRNDLITYAKEQNVDIDVQDKYG